jgi:K+-sensing histidine kinase KdpD
MILLVTLFYVRSVTASATTVGFTFLLVIFERLHDLGPGSLLHDVGGRNTGDYFLLPPVVSLDVADLQDWVALFSFVVTAFQGSSLSARA